MGMKIGWLKASVAAGAGARWMLAQWSKIRDAAAVPHKARELEHWRRTKEVQLKQQCVVSLIIFWLSTGGLVVVNPPSDPYVVVANRIFLIETMWAIIREEPGML